MPILQENKSVSFFDKIRHKSPENTKNSLFNNFMINGEKSRITKKISKFAGIDLQEQNVRKTQRDEKLFEIVSNLKKSLEITINEKITKNSSYSPRSYREIRKNKLSPKACQPQTPNKISENRFSMNTPEPKNRQNNLIKTPNSSKMTPKNKPKFKKTGTVELSENQQKINSAKKSTKPPLQKKILKNAFEINEKQSKKSNSKGYLSDSGVKCK